MVAPHPGTRIVCDASVTIVHDASPAPVRTHTGSVQCCGAGFFVSGVPMNRLCAIDTSVEPLTHLVFALSSGAPGCSTKLFMMRLTGFSVMPVSLLQKSSPAALFCEYFDRYDDTRLRDASGP